MSRSMGTQIRTLRKEKTMTMKQLAKEVGLTEQAISQYERDIRTPNDDILEKIATTLKVSKSDLYPIIEFDDLKLIIEVVLKLMNRSLSDEPNISWDDIKGFTSKEFFEFSNYVLNWCNSIIRNRENTPISEKDVAFSYNGGDKKEFNPD